MGTNCHVSIIVSNLENHPSLPRMLQSVARQSTGLAGVELLIAGNGSHAPSSHASWSAIADTESITFVATEADASASQAINAAAQRSTGELLLFMRPDYRLDPKYLTTAHTVFDDIPEADVMYADYIRLAPEKNPNVKPDLIQLPDFEDSLLQTMNFLGPAVMMRRNVWERLDGFRDNTTYRYWDLWVQAANAGSRFYHVNYPLASCAHVKVPFRERAEDGRRKAIIVINNQAYFHMHTVRWALAYLRGDSWAQSFAFMTIPDPIEVTRMMHEHNMKSMGTDVLVQEAIRQFDKTSFQA
jgi:cellulose synthase/poly-beta-1,6-N-acetylglucosamine synthase-like glycosyltransferase